MKKKKENNTKIEKFQFTPMFVKLTPCSFYQLIWSTVKTSGLVKKLADDVRFS